METKTNSRGRPKKDFWELKNKLAIEAAENKGKVSRGRPKKQRTIDDSINTKISNHHKDVAILEKKNQEIHESMSVNSEKNNNNRENNAEKYSKIALCFSIIFCVFAILYWIVSSVKSQNKELVFSEINNTWYTQDNTQDNTQENQIQIQIWYNNESWDFVEIENIDIANNDEQINDDYRSETNDENDSALVVLDEISNSDVDLIKSFYDKINKREFSELSSLTDRYLRNSDAYRTYFSSNWLNHFLDKIVWNKIIVWWFYESPSNKPTAKNYRYNVKYKLPTSNGMTNEDREIAIVDRNWERLIWSIMCITTWCSRMPFFQK